LEVSRLIQKGAVKLSLPFTEWTEALFENPTVLSHAFDGLLPGRETFVIDRDGAIRLRFNSLLDAQSHVSEALRVLKALAEKAGK